MSVKKRHRVSGRFSKFSSMISLAVAGTTIERAIARMRNRRCLTNIPIPWGYATLIEATLMSSSKYAAPDLSSIGRANSSAYYLCRIPKTLPPRVKLFEFA